MLVSLYGCYAQFAHNCIFCLHFFHLLHANSLLPCSYSCVKDLIYEHSIQVGDTAPRILYRGRDFQYYFSLPQGAPDDDFKGKNPHLYPQCDIPFSQVNANMPLFSTK